MTFFTFIGKDQIVVERTIGTFYIHKERPNSDGKNPHTLVGRTIDTLYTHRERLGGDGKAHMHL